MIVIPDELPLEPALILKPLLIGFWQLCFCQLLRPVDFHIQSWVSTLRQTAESTTELYGTLAIRIKADGTQLQRSGFTYLLHKITAGWKFTESSR